jgi:hypothetical protein
MDHALCCRQKKVFSHYGENKYIHTGIYSSLQVMVISLIPFRRSLGENGGVSGQMCVDPGHERERGGVGAKMDHSKT